MAAPLAAPTVAPADEDLVTLTASKSRTVACKRASVAASDERNAQDQRSIDVPPQNLMSISTPLGGYLKTTNMLPGTHVQKGQLLAVMEDSQYIQLQQDYLLVRNKLNYAQKGFDRQRELNSIKSQQRCVAAGRKRIPQPQHSKALAAKLSLAINAQNASRKTIAIRN